MHILVQKLDLKVALVGPGGCGKSALATRILTRFLFLYQHIQYSSRTGVNNEQSKISYDISSSSVQQIIFVRRYITEYCPVLEGVYSRGLNVAGLEVTMLCNLIEVGTF